jgi:hypothetical protein
MTTLSFTTSASITDNKITISSHGMETHFAVKYNNGTDPSPYDIGLTDDSVYYVIKLDTNNIYLAQNFNDIKLFLGEFTELINTDTDEIYLEDHGFSTGDRVVYSSQDGISVGGLGSWNIYYVIRVDDNKLKLADNLSAASAGNSIDITTVGSGYSHLLAKYVSLTDGSEPEQTHNLIYDYYLDEAGVGGGDLWEQSGSDIYYNSGNVGIGTTTPAAAEPTTLNVVGGGSNISTALFESSNDANYVKIASNPDLSGYNDTGLAFGFNNSVGQSITDLFSIGAENNTSDGKNFYIYDNVYDAYRIYISDAGTIGINTTIPKGSFGLSNSAGTAGSIVIGNQSSTGSYATLRLLAASGGGTFIQSGQNYSSGSATPIIFGPILSATEWLRITTDGNIKIGGSANRGTTEGTNQLVIFNGTAPSGTLTDGASFYAASGEMRVMDSAGNNTLLSPHDHNTNEWIFDSIDTRTGKHLRIDVERLLRFVNEHFGLDCVHDFVKEV